jgi:hypothetical protein
VDFTTGSWAKSVAIGDMDGDDKLDVVVVDQGANKVSVLRNTSSSGIPSFDAKVDFTAGTTPRRVSLADLDGDGKPEMVVSNLDAYTLSIFKNNSTSGTLSFDSKVDFTTGSGAINLGPLESNLGDLNGDGKPEIAVVTQGANTVSFFRNTLVLPSTITSFSPTSARTGDTILITKKLTTVAQLPWWINLWEQPYLSKEKPSPSRVPREVWENPYSNTCNCKRQRLSPSLPNLSL